MRLIDADALMKDIAVLEEGLEDMLDEYPEANHIDSHERTKIYISIEDINTFKEMLEEAPTVQRPMGEWIKPTVINGKAFSICHCSACGGVPCGVDENTKFCPECGADMRGEGE